MQKFENFTLTNHFVDRFHERVDSSILTNKDIEDFLREKEYEFLVLAEYVDKKMCNFLLSNINEKNYVIVVNETFQALITIYEVDFGFSKQANDSIIKITVDESREISLQLQRLEEKLQLSKDKLNSEIIEVEFAIDSLKRELKSYEDKHKSLKNQLSEQILETSSLREQLNRVLYKIIYSINYQFDKLTRK